MALQECQDPSEAALQAGVRSPVEGLAMEELHDDALSARYGKGAEQRVRCAPDDAIGALAVPMHGEAADLLQLHGRRVALPECPVVEPADLLAVILQGLEAEDCHEDVLVVGAPLQLGARELLGDEGVLAAKVRSSAKPSVHRPQGCEDVLEGNRGTRGSSRPSCKNRCRSMCLAVLAALARSAVLVGRGRGPVIHDQVNQLALLCDADRDGDAFFRNLLLQLLHRKLLHVSALHLWLAPACRPVAPGVLLVLPGVFGAAAVGLLLTAVAVPARGGPVAPSLAAVVVVLLVHALLGARALLRGSVSLVRGLGGSILFLGLRADGIPVGLSFSALRPGLLRGSGSPVGVLGGSILLLGLLAGLLLGGSGRPVGGLSGSVLVLGLLGGSSSPSRGFGSVLLLRLQRISRIVS
mmetsp:Transcript_3950/g.12067  ORF Transcript_3950/g.12067 Transcript_3950/m.12067 type:complete len:410 (-) Transcript_3950:213-1442(-)